MRKERLGITQSLHKFFAQFGDGFISFPRAIWGRGRFAECVCVRDLGTGSIRTAAHVMQAQSPVSGQSHLALFPSANKSLAIWGRVQFVQPFCRSGDGLDSYNLIMLREPNPPSVDRAVSFLEPARQGTSITLEIRPPRMKTQLCNRHAFLDTSETTPSPD